MALVLQEDDVRDLLTMDETIRVLDATFRHQGTGAARNQPRSRVVHPVSGSVLHVLPAFVPGQPGHPERDGAGLVGLKSYTSFGGRARFIVLLYSGESGELLALVEADLLGQMRTGAASGVATRYMARADAVTLGMIGTGGQARTQALAIAAVRPLQRMVVFGPNAARRQTFASDLAAQTGIEVVPVESARAAVQMADILCTATTARDPIVSAEWVQPGTHLNVIGSNWAHRREVDEQTVARADVVAVDALDQARLEAGDLLFAERAGLFSFAHAVELGAIVAGATPGRRDATDVTFFKSLGIGLEDVAVAGLVYALARERGLGKELDIVL